MLGRGCCPQAGHFNHFLLRGTIEKRKIIVPAKIGQFMEGKNRSAIFHTGVSKRLRLVLYLQKYD